MPQALQGAPAGVQLWGLLGALFRSWGLLAAFMRMEWGTENEGAGGGLSERRGSVTFFSWPSGDSGTKLMLISSTSELDEPAECTLSASAMSPLLR